MTSSIASALLRGALRGFHRAGVFGLQRCPQCWRELPPQDFVSDRGPWTSTQCLRCRVRYRGWGRLTDAQRLKRVRRHTQASTTVHDGPRRVVLTPRSNNHKTGPIPVSVTDDGSCPSSCPFQGAGCYAAYGHLGGRWRTIPQRGVSWDKFCELVTQLPQGQLWRHNEAGDLPGDGRPGDGLDHAALAQLVLANRGRRGFTFTHRPLSSAADRIAVRRANAEGFVVNLSADSLEDADRLAALQVGPVAVVLPAPTGSWGPGLAHPGPRVHTPGGLKVVVCPAQTHGMTCLQCRLCAVPGRKSVVGFLAHGQGKALVTQIVRTKRSTA